MSLHRRISTIIATHDRPQLLRDALDSLAAQTLRPFEVIVVDDGSGPATRRAIDAWRRKSGDLHVRYLYQHNQGPARARNNGLAHARGEFIQFMDDDDLMEPDALRQLADVLSPMRRPAIAVASHVVLDRGATTAAGPLSRPATGSFTQRLSSMIAGDWFVPIHGYLLNRGALAGTGMWDPGYSSQEDDDFLLRAALAEAEFVPAPRALVYYRQHDGVRRATPGKPGETVAQGRRKRMLDDLLIRERTAARLRASGELERYRDAFERWLDRFRARYADLLPDLRVTPPLLAWLGLHAATSRTATEMRRARPVGEPGDGPAWHRPRRLASTAAP